MATAPTGDCETVDAAGLFLIDRDLRRAGGDPIQAVTSGEWVLAYLATQAPDHYTRRVLDVGCGDGRVASAYARAAVAALRYTGFDIHAGRIAALNRLFSRAALADGSDYRFHHADVFHSYYNPGGTIEPERIDYPFIWGEPERRFDLIFYNSVFSHMALPVIRRHLGQACGVLDPDGVIWMTTYLIDSDQEPPYVFGASSFSTPYGGGLSATPDNPEGAVAHFEPMMAEVVAEAGLRIVRKIPGFWKAPRRSLDQHEQDILLLRRL